MDLFNLLKEDHQKVTELLEKIANTSEKAKATREKVFDEAIEEIKNHTKMEEKFFYPALRDYPKMHELILEAYEEHHLVDKLIKELLKVDYGDEKWKAKFTVLKENIHHHIEEEENCLFPLIEKTLSQEEINELGEQLSEFKEKQLEKA